MHRQNSFLGEMQCKVALQVPLDVQAVLDLAMSGTVIFMAASICIENP
jgi:hypothetical protein